MSGRLWIAAKAPRPGFVKTRLARSIGEERAVELYAAFLQDLALRFRNGRPVGWYVTPDDAWPELERLLGEQRGALVLPQGDGDWDRRQRRLFTGAARRGEHQTVLIASDSPQLEAEVVDEAFRALDAHDVVLGPVADGGYYLIGMRGHHDVLRGVEMSRDSVLADIVAQAERLGCSVALLDDTFDVDEAADLIPLRRLARARRDLTRTAAVLKRVE
jgi:rSAM/selenodomain-associated transferase 1